MPESPAHSDRVSSVPLLTLNLACEPDAVSARQRARQLANLLGFDRQDQIRLATATSEITRNALQYGGGGRVEFAVELLPQPFFAVQVFDAGPGIPDVAAVLEGRYHSPTGLGLGLAGTRRLMDRFAVETAAGKGTVVRFGKTLPAASAPLDPARLPELSAQLTGGHTQTAYEEIQQQNRELLEALEIVRRRESELAHLNQELEETNRGVVALYGELDDKAEALRRANEIKSRFLSHMSHEFRTPLNSILALTSRGEPGRRRPYTKPGDAQVEYVRRAAEELFEMVNDLLDLAKVESGRIELHIAPTAIATLFGTLRAMLRPLASNTAVELHIEEPSADLVVQTDEGKLTQILRNLVSNALKFTERGEVRLSCWRAADEAFFSVTDTGIGIAAETRNEFFRISPRWSTLSSAK